MTHKTFDLAKHLREEHKMTPFSTYIREIVYGGTDGIVTTFAVVAGFTGANNEVVNIPLVAVVIFGLANLFADGVSMGLGSFLSTRAEKDLYIGEQRKEEHEVEHNINVEKEESAQILVNKGFTPKQAQDLVAIYATNKPFWVNFMMNHELGLADPDEAHPALMGLVTFISFVTFGMIPLIPYLFLQTTSFLFIYSCLATLTALVVLGSLRYRVTRQSFFRSVLETLLVGSTAASIAYLVGFFFRI